MSTDSKSKKTGFEWSKLQHTRYTTFCKYMCFGGLFVVSEAWLGLNDKSIMTHSLAKLASYISMKLILDRIEDLSCAWCSIIGQENPGSKSCIWAKNTWAVAQFPTLHGEDQRCTRTSIIRQQKLRLCHEYVSPCLRFWHKYPIWPRLRNGISKYAVLDLSRRYAEDSPVQLNLHYMPWKAPALPQISKPCHILRNM